jgi:inner membrane protein
LDPLTHFLTGACMGRSGFNRKSALTTLTMVLAAEAADVDMLWALKSPVAALQHHRGITHSFVGVPFVAASVLAFVYVIHRIRRRRADAIKARGKPPVRWGYLYLFALIAALSHPLLDYTTAYGIRLFEPFNYRWYTWDIVYIVDPVIWAVLIAGLALPALFGLINQEIGVRSKGPQGRAGAIAALLCFVLIWGFRDYQHRRAVNAMDSFLYRGAEPQRVAAYPYMINPFRWHGVVETADFFETVPVNSIGPEIEDSQARLFYKPEETEVLSVAKSTYFGRVYLDWAVFPYVQQQKLEGETRGYFVDFQDLRYTYPETSGRTALGGYVVLDPDLRVLMQGMNSWTSPTPASLERQPERR